MLIIFGPVSEVHSGPADGQWWVGAERVGCCPWDPFASIKLSASNILVCSKRLREQMWQDTIRFHTGVNHDLSHNSKESVFILKN